MNKVYYCNKFWNCFIIELFIIFVSLNIVFPQLLNNIIRLGDDNFRYSHLSINSNGDMIVDSESYPTSQERRFFGLKKNGHFYFTDLYNQETAYCSLNASHDSGRIEGESIFITFSDVNHNQLLLGIPKNKGYFGEFYDFVEKKLSSFFAYDMFGNILSEIFSIMEIPGNSGNNHIYIFSYVANKEIDENHGYNCLIVRTMKFLYNEPYYQIIQEKEFYSQSSMVSCFFTGSLKYICFYKDESKKLNVIVFDDTSLSNSKKTMIYDPGSSSGSNEKFYKAIHVNGEIGAFLLYKNDVMNIPFFSLYKCCGTNNELQKIESLYNIEINKSSFNEEIKLNDLVKLNDNKICFISASSNKDLLNIIVLSFYNNYEKMNIRYYIIKMWEKYNQKFYKEIKSILYKNFLTIAYSHCPQSNCEGNRDTHFASLLIFSYSNSSINSSLDIIHEIYFSNKYIENDFSFNLEGENIIIDNNIFGFVFKGIKILNIPNDITLINSTNKSIISNESTISKDENISLIFNTHDKYVAKNYVIEFAYALTEPNYDELSNYINETDITHGIWNEKDLYEYHEYVGKSSFYTLIVSEDLLKTCNKEECSLCFSNDTCVICSYNYTFNDSIKNCMPKPITTIPFTTIPFTTIPFTTIPFTTIPETTISYTTVPKTTISVTTIPETTTILGVRTTVPHTSIITQNIIINSDYPNFDCTNEVILSGMCKGNMNKEQIPKIYEILHSQMNSTTNEIIETNNVVFQISTLEQQKNNNNPSVSSLDLRECEQLLKQQEGLTETEDLIIFKTDLKSEDLSSTYVQYEVYNPRTLGIVSLKICKNIPIEISVQVNINENTQSICNSLDQLGYKLFDLNDPFYNDICSTYTTENGTDLILADRKSLIYDNNNNITMCQSGCHFQDYNCTTKRVKCDCSVQLEETIKDIKKLFFNEKELINMFFTTLENSNFLVLKCYKLVFSAKGQINNIGSYIMSGIYFIFIILLFIYIIKGNSQITDYIQNALRMKFYKKESEKNSNCKFLQVKKKAIIAKNKKNMNRNNIIKKEKVVNKKTKIQINSKKSNEKAKKRKNFPPKKKRFSINIYSKNPFNKKTVEDTNMTSKTLKRIKIRNNLFGKKRKNNKGKGNVNIIKINNNIKIKKNVIIKPKNSPYNNINKKVGIKSNEYKNLNDHEMNNLEYELARQLDKRTYFQYYFSLLKKKQLILFAFVPVNDYNLMMIKVSLLLLSFSLFFTINGFFFSDKTMNKINKDKGAYDFLYQIPQILYSTVISALINLILKQLSLSERQILNIKQEKTFLKAKEKAKKIRKCLKIKLIIFFIFSLSLMCFFWYFISCFCAVYKNTQIILINDTLISFGASMLYPFGLNLLPGMFRIPALRSKTNDKQLLYKLSLYIALI